MTHTTNLVVAAAVGEGLHDSSIACSDQQQALKARLVQGAETIESLLRDIHDLLNEVRDLRAFKANVTRSTGDQPT